jgi:hypothetical protein
VEATKVPWVSAAVFTTLQRACQCHPLPSGICPWRLGAAWVPGSRVKHSGAGPPSEELSSLQAADLREGRRAEEVRKTPGSRQSSEDGRAELVLITKRSKTAAYLHEELYDTGLTGPGHHLEWGRQGTLIQHGMMNQRSQRSQGPERAISLGRTT